MGAIGYCFFVAPMKLQTSQDRFPGGVQGQSPWSGVRRLKPPEAEKLLVFFTPKENQNLATFQGFLGSFISDPLEVTDPFSIIYP